MKSPVTDSYVYEAFGELRASTGSTENFFTWVGELGYVRDIQTGELHLGARQYTPAEARFKSEDPLELDIGQSSFSYGLNRPTMLVDPSGEAPIEACQKDLEKLLKQRSVEYAEYLQRLAHFESLERALYALDARIKDLSSRIPKASRGGFGRIRRGAKRHEDMFYTDEEIRHAEEYRAELRRLQNELWTLAKKVSAADVNAQIARQDVEHLDAQIAELAKRCPKAKLPALPDTKLCSVDIDVDPETGEGCEEDCEDALQIRMYYPCNKPEEAALLDQEKRKAAILKGLKKLKDDIELGRQVSEIVITEILPGGQIVETTVAVTELQADPSTCGAVFLLLGLFPFLKSRRPGFAFSPDDVPGGGGRRPPRRGIGGRGWRGDKKWRDLINRLKRGGTIDNVDGLIPTKEEALELIQEVGGTVDRIEGPHPPVPGRAIPNPHDYPHINFTLPDGTKGTIRIQEL